MLSLLCLKRLTVGEFLVDDFPRERITNRYACGVHCVTTLHLAQLG